MKTLMANLLWLGGLVMLHGEIAGIDDVKLPEFDKLIKIQDELADPILQISRETGIVFCRESTDWGDSGLQKKLIPKSEDAVAVSEVIRKMQGFGYKFKIFGKAVLVSTPSMKDVKFNPLDLRVKNFQFKGSHVEFRSAIAKAFPEVLFGGMDTERSNAEFSQVRYAINLDGPVTLREVLMESANRNRLAWKAVIPENRGGAVDKPIMVIDYAVVPNEQEQTGGNGADLPPKKPLEAVPTVEH